MIFSENRYPLFRIMLKKLRAKSEPELVGSWSAAMAAWFVVIEYKLPISPNL
jgi:hypothetical protein